MTETASAMTAASNQWKPLLIGKYFDDATAAVDCISKDLGRISRAWLPHRGTKQDKDIITTVRLFAEQGRVTTSLCKG